MKQNKLKIYIHTNEDINKHIQQKLCQVIAQSIYDSEDFQKYISQTIQPAS